MEDSPQVSLVEQAIVNLSKILRDFIGNQKDINTQVNKMMDYIEIALNQIVCKLMSTKKLTTFS